MKIISHCYRMLTNYFVKNLCCFGLQLIVDNLKAFNAAVVTEKPLFQVETLLAPPDVVLHPAANEVYKLTLQCIRDCVERLIYVILFHTTSLAGVESKIHTVDSSIDQSTLFRDIVLILRPHFCYELSFTLKILKKW